MRHVTATYIVDTDCEDDEDPQDAASSTLRDLLDQGFEPTELVVVDVEGFA